MEKENKATRPLKSLTDALTWEWVEEQDDYIQGLYKNQLGSKLQRSSISNYEELEKDPDKKVLLNDKDFYYGYVRLSKFPINHLDLFSIEPKDLKNLAKYVIKKPWVIEYIDDVTLNGNTATIIKSYAKIMHEYGFDAEMAKDVITHLNGEDLTSKEKEDIYNVIVELAKLHKCMIDADNICDADIKHRAEIKLIAEGCKNSILDIYLKRIELNEDDQDDDRVSQIYHSGLENEYYEDRIREDLSNLEFYAAHTPIAIPMDEIHTLVTEYQAFLASPEALEYRELYRARSKAEADDKKIQKDAKKLGCSVRELNNAISRVQEMLQSKPVFPEKHYQTMYPGKVSLKRDISWMEKVRPNLYKEYNRLIHDNADIIHGKRATQYKNFAQLLLSRKPTKDTGITKFTNSTLFDLITTIETFDRKEYEALTDSLPNLNARERTALRGFYNEKIVNGDCLYPRDKKIFIDNNLIVIKGKEITKEVKEKIIEYMEEKKQPLYQPIYMAIVRAWFDGELEIEGLDPKDLPDYTK